MIARGDLGVEVPMQEVPLLQKEIISKCLTLSRPALLFASAPLVSQSGNLPTANFRERTDLFIDFFDQDQVLESILYVLRILLRELCSRMLFLGIGEDVNREGLLKTPSQSLFYLGSLLGLTSLGVGGPFEGERWRGYEYAFRNGEGCKAPSYRHRPKGGEIMLLVV